MSEIQSGDRGGDELPRVDRGRHGPGVANAAAGQNPHSAVLFSNSSFFLLNCAPSALSAIFRASCRDRGETHQECVPEESAGSYRREASRQMLHGTELNFQGHKL